MVLATHWVHGARLFTDHMHNLVFHEFVSYFDDTVIVHEPNCKVLNVPVVEGEDARNSQA